MLVAEIMTRGCERVKANDSIRTAAQLMREHDIGMVLVEGEGGDLCGVVTDRDITCRAMADGKGSDTPVEMCMTREPISCSQDDDAYDAIELMKRERVRRLLVRDLDHKPVGVLAQADIALALAPYGPAADMVEEVSQPGGKHSQG